MAARQAKVSIGLDYKPLRQDVRDAKKALGDIGNAKIDPALQKNLKGIFARDLYQQTETYKKKIGEIVTELKRMGAAGQAAADPAQLQRMMRTLAEYQAALRRTRQLMRDGATAVATPAMARPSPEAPGAPADPGAPQPPPKTPPAPRRPVYAPQPAGGGPPEEEEGGGGGGGGGGSRFSPMRAFSGLRGAAATLGIGLGVSAALGRSEERGRAGLRVRELTGGNTVGGSSGLGFTDMERRQRALEIASQSGKDMGQPEITRRVDQSEKLERAYGISGGQYAGAIGASRKAGVGDQDKFIAETIGDAVAMKLSGSAVGEYLASMTNYLSSISKGVDVKEGSLRGFAASLGSLEFFKRDPERIFDALSKLDQLFKGGGDEFQKFSTYRAIEQAGGGAEKVGPAGVEVRRSLGMFGGGGGLGQRARAEGMEDLGKTVDINGEDAINNFLTGAFKTAQAGGKIGGKNGKVDNNVAAQLFQSITGLNDQAGIETYIAMAGQQRKGKGAALPKAAKEAFEKSMQSPDERMKAVLGNFDGAVVKFSKRVDDLKNVVSDGITEGVLGLVDGIDEFSKATGLFESDVEKFGAAVALLAAGKGASALVEGAGGFAGAALGAGAAGAGMRAIGFLGVGGAVVAAGAAGFLIGEGIRAELNKWTKGEWDDSVNGAWNSLKKILNHIPGVNFDTVSDDDEKAMSTQKDEQKLFDQYGQKNVAEDEKGTARANGREGFMMNQERTVKEIKSDMEFKTDREKSYKEAGYDEQKSGEEIDKEMKDRQETRARKLAKDTKGKAEYEMMKLGQITEDQLSPEGKEALATTMLPGGKHDYEERYGGLSMTPKAKDKLFESHGIDPKSPLAQLQAVSPDQAVEPVSDSGMSRGGKVLPFRRGGQVLSFEDGGEIPRPDIKDFGGSWSLEMDKAYKLWKEGKDWRKGGHDLKGGIAAGFSKMFGRAGGGPIGHNSIMGYRSGGSAIGTDKIDAKLTAGEFVVNARDSSANMSALVHANAGGRIVAAADGGMMGDMMPMLASDPEGYSDDRADPPAPITGGADKLKIDSGLMEAALSGNTRALMTLAQALSGAGGGGSPSMRSIPRGAQGVKYG